jgi:hypothetical protein
MKSDDEQTHNNHSHLGFITKTNQRGKFEFIAPVAWMIIFGDGLHNFIGIDRRAEKTDWEKKDLI